jgi:hypothetical protein
MLLPKLTLGRHAGAGVISVKPDDDGVLRGISLFHRVYGKTFPVMPMAALYEPGVTPELSMRANVLTVGSHRWRLDSEGRVLIHRGDDYRVGGAWNRCGIDRAYRRIRLVCADVECPAGHFARSDGVVGPTRSAI